jgi:hypothetical protein
MKINSNTLLGINLSRMIMETCEFRKRVTFDEEWTYQIYKHQKMYLYLCNRNPQQ